MHHVTSINATNDGDITVNLEIDDMHNLVEAYGENGLRLTLVKTPTQLGEDELVDVVYFISGPMAGCYGLQTRGSDCSLSSIADLDGETIQMNGAWIIPNLVPKSIADYAREVCQ